MSNDPINNEQLRLMVASDLEGVLKLRNHPEVRRYMFTQHEISIEEHALWFERASHNQSVRLLIFDVDKVCMGFVQLKKTSEPGVVSWGFYVTPDAPKGMGRRLGNAALSRVFEVENFHKICGQALYYNQPSIDFHKSLGFTQESVLQRQHLIGEKYHDLICFGLNKTEWSKFKKYKGMAG
jgi:UDP-4-amino-4,6-dideoxy-N-acetyl-beta-L-altrosamine N-acetyltransferase